MEETYRETRENYNTNANALSTLNTEIKEEHDAFSIQQKSLKNIYTQLCHRRSALNEQHSSAKKELGIIKGKEEQTKLKQKSRQQNHMAQLLREELEEGALCPVCGTPYKEHVSQSHIAENVKTSSETISDVTTKRDTEAFSKNDSETIEKKDAELSEISFKNLEKELKKLEKQQQTQQNLIQQLEQELFSLDTHISNLKDALEITDEDTIEDNETDRHFAINENISQASPVIVEKPIDYFSISKQISTYLQAKGDLRRQKEQCERQAATLKEQHSALQSYAEEILTLRKDNNIENFSNALETLRQKEQERQQKEITIKEQRQHLEKTGRLETDMIIYTETTDPKKQRIGQTY